MSSGAMMAKNAKSVPRSQPSGPSSAYWLIPIASVLIMWVYLLYSLGYIDSFGIERRIWYWGPIGLELLLVLVLLASHALDTRAAAPCADDDDSDVIEVKPEVIEVKAEVVEAPAAPVVKPTPAPPAPAPRVSGDTLEYPGEISGGIYADAHINVGGGKILKLRTLLARSCLRCDSADNCWTVVRHRVSSDVFKSNIECKAGLNIQE